MIDHLLAFADEVAAHADSVVGQYWTPGTRNSPPFWHSECVPNVLMWSPAGDTTEIVTGPAGDHEMIVHNAVDTQFRVLIALPAAAQDLIDHPNLELAVDHELGTALGGSLTPEQRAGFCIQPVFSGSAYPFLTDVTKGLVVTNERASSSRSVHRPDAHHRSAGRLDRRRKNKW
jgi:hypothetical protein